MVTNYKCDSCKFEPKCAARAKLKPFTEEARVDLGLTLDFAECTDYSELDDENNDAENDED